MKLTHLLVATLSLISMLSLGACSGEYNDPETGASTPFEAPDPQTPAEKKAAYEDLEAKKKTVDDAKAKWAAEGNQTLVAAMDENIEKIADAKADIGYTPPKHISERNLVSSMSMSAF